MRVFGVYTPAPCGYHEWDDSAVQNNDNSILCRRVVPKRSQPLAAPPPPSQHVPLASSPPPPMPSMGAPSPLRPSFTGIAADTLRLPWSPPSSSDTLASNIAAISSHTSSAAMRAPSSLPILDEATLVRLINQASQLHAARYALGGVAQGRPRTARLGGLLRVRAAGAAPCTARPLVHVAAATVATAMASLTTTRVSARSVVPWAI